MLQNFKPAASGLGLVYLKGGPCEFAYYDFFDKIVRGSPEKTPTAIEDMVVTQGDEILFRSVSYTEPYRWHRYDSSRNKSLVDETALASKIPVSFTDAEVIREMVTFPRTGQSAAEHFPQARHAAARATTQPS